MNLAIQNRVYRQKSTTLLMVVAHQKREHEEAAECVLYVTSYVTILSFIKSGCHQQNKWMRWRAERSAGKQIMRPTLAQLRAAITTYLLTECVRPFSQVKSGHLLPYYRPTYHLGQYVVFQLPNFYRTSSTSSTITRQGAAHRHSLTGLAQPAQNGRRLGAKQLITTQSTASV